MVCDLAHQAGACGGGRQCIRNALLQQPLQTGADVVVYSATKHIDGQGRSLGGVVLGSQSSSPRPLQPFCATPAIAEPDERLDSAQGPGDIGRRLEQSCTSALEIAEKLSGHLKLAQVLIPTLASFPQYDLAKRQMKAGGSVVSISLKGGKAAAFQVPERAATRLISNNPRRFQVAGHPSDDHDPSAPDAGATPGQGIDDGLVRISVGLEDAADLIDDLTQALAA